MNTSKSFNEEQKSEPKGQYWYILKTKSNAEKVVQNRLQAIEKEVYLPMYEAIRIWSDRKKKIEIPLLSTYVFVRCGLNELESITRVPGVAWLVQDMGIPAVVKEYEIENLRIFAQEKEGHKHEELSDYSVGETVQVTHGNFQGLIGKMVHSKGEYRVMMEVNCIGSSFFINVPKSQVAKI